MPVQKSLYPIFTHFNWWKNYLPEAFTPIHISLYLQSRVVYCKAQTPPSRICNTVVGVTTNPLLALKTNLTDSCDGGRNKRPTLVSEPCNQRILTVFTIYKDTFKQNGFHFLNVKVFMVFRKKKRNAVYCNWF